MSESGAKIELLSTKPVPDEFETFINEQKVRRSYVVIRRKDRKISISFVA